MQSQVAEGGFEAVGGAAPPEAFQPGLRYGPALVVAALIAYAPFVAMAGYAQFFMTCEHCKVAARQLLPCAPGVLPLGFLGQVLGFRFPSQTAFGWAASAVSVLLVVALARVLQRERRMAIAALIVAIPVFTGLAWMTLAVIRA